MLIDELKDIIKREWGVNYDDIDSNTPLIILAENIAMDSENCSREEVYKMYIDNPSLHLPGLIAFYIIDELGITSQKVNAGMTLSEIILLEKLEK